MRGKAKGIVVAHGTDTMIYSVLAAALMLKNIPIPVIFTGSNIPLDNPDSDASQNLSHALWAAFRSSLKGVFVSFAGTQNGDSLILSPFDLRKEAYRKDCFRPVWDKPIGRISSSFFRNLPKISIDPSRILTSKPGDFESVKTVAQEIKGPASCRTSPSSPGGYRSLLGGSSVFGQTSNSYLYCHQPDSHGKETAKNA